MKKELEKAPFFMSAASAQHGDHTQQKNSQHDRSGAGCDRREKGAL
jgi:hypothetical protein